MKKLAGKSAVITGAGSGLGLEFVRLAAKLGMNITLVDINSESLEKAQKEINALGVKTIVVKADVSSYSDMENVAQKAEEAFGPTTLLINNAGVSMNGLIWEIEDVNWQRVLGINFYGIVNGVKAFIPRMLKAVNNDDNYYGYIVNTASVNGFCALPTMGPYNTSKAAAVSISETLQADLDLVTDKIKVSVLIPGPVKTNIAKATFKPEDQSSEESKAFSASREMFTNFINGAHYKASNIAESTFKALENGDFYVFFGEDEQFSVSKRMENVMKGSYFNALKTLDEKAYDRMMEQMK